jgi:Kef-type K+ transport system membrane component KefB
VVKHQTLALVAKTLDLAGPRIVPALERERRPDRQLAIVVASAIAAAAITSVIGVHAFLGPFVLGAVVPSTGLSAQAIRARVGPIVDVLLPAFFAITGLRMHVQLLAGPADWIACVLIILVATVGKFGGSVAAARATGVPWAEAASLGVLMNTRGLMELVVLNIGLDLGMISESLFAMFVIMSLVTTIATTPVLSVMMRATAVTPARDASVA